MSTATSLNFFQKVLAWVENIFTEIPTIEQYIATFADQVANKLKTLEPTIEAIANFLENDLVPIAETIYPALTPMISGLQLEIPKIIKAVVNTGNIATSIAGEAIKPEAQQVADALSALQASKLASGTISTVQAAYAGAVTTLATAISGFVTSNNSIVATAADLLSTQVAVHAKAA